MDIIWKKDFRLNDEESALKSLHKVFSYPTALLFEDKTNFKDLLYYYLSLVPTEHECYNTVQHIKMNKDGSLELLLDLLVSYNDYPYYQNLTYKVRLGNEKKCNGTRECLTGTISGEMYHSLMIARLLEEEWIPMLIL